MFEDVAGERRRERRERQWKGEEMSSDPRARVAALLPGMSKRKARQLLTALAVQEAAERAGLDVALSVVVTKALDPSDGEGVSSVEPSRE